LVGLARARKVELSVFQIFRQGDVCFREVRRQRDGLTGIGLCLAEVLADVRAGGIRSQKKGFGAAGEREREGRVQPDGIRVKSRRAQ
jgi:hypothetical protein